MIPLLLFSLASLAPPASLAILPSLPLQSGGDKELVLILEGTTADEQVGLDLDRAGDVNGDGYDDLLVGCENSIARIYSGFDGSILREYSFGSSVANLGDLDHDGFDDFAFGSIFEPWVWTVVTVVSGNANTVLMEIKRNNFSDFGKEVAAAGDLDGDGTPDLFIGAPLSPTVESGTVHAYSGATGAELYTLTGWDSWERFGHHIASLGDIDHDGVPDFLVQAEGDFWAASLPATYIFSGLGNQIAWHYDENSGRAVGDVDGDGIGDYSHSTYYLETTTVRSGANQEELYTSVGQLAVGFGDLDGDGRAEIGKKLKAKFELHSGMSGIHQSTFPSSGGWDPAPACHAGNIRGDGKPHIAIADPNYSSTKQKVGRVEVYRFHPILSLDAASLSATGNQTVTASLNFPASETGHSYCMLTSATGVGPIQVGPVLIPLTDDHVFYTALQGHADDVVVFDRIGILDGNGCGAATMVSHPALAPFAGMDLYLAAIAFSPTRVRISSAATKLKILP
jgi:hypothetical protein